MSALTQSGHRPDTIAKKGRDGQEERRSVTNVSALDPEAGAVAGRRAPLCCLLFFKIRVRNNVRPPLDFGAHALIKWSCRQRPRIETNLFEFRFYDRLFKDFSCCVAEYIHSLLRHAFRTVERIPGDHHKIRNTGFSHCRHVRKIRISAAGSYSKRTDLFSINLRSQPAISIYNNIHVVAQQGDGKF